MKREKIWRERQSKDGLSEKWNRQSADQGLIQVNIVLKCNFLSNSAAMSTRYYTMNSKTHGEVACTASQCNVDYLILPMLFYVYRDPLYKFGSFQDIDS